MDRPHDGVGGVTPTPRKDSAASAPILPGMEMVVKTMIVATRLGSICRTTMCTWLAPIACEARMKVRDRNDIAWLRSTRAVEGHPSSPMMRTMTVTRGAVAGMTAEIAIMKTSCGNPRITSVPRDATASHQPPK